MGRNLRVNEATPKPNPGGGGGGGGRRDFGRSRRNDRYQSLTLKSNLSMTNQGTVNGLTQRRYGFILKEASGVVRPQIRL